MKLNSLKTKNYKLKTINGFTLIELLVASAIFSIVSIVAIGAVLTIMSANRKAQAVRAVVDNLNFTLETMSRKLIVGDTFTCSSESSVVSPLFPTANFFCPKGASWISFWTYENLSNSARETATAYSLDSSNGRIVEYTQVGNGFDGGSSITPPEIKISDLKFFYRGRTSTAGSIITILVRGQIHLSKENIDVPLNLETSVTPRKK